MNIKVGARVKIIKNDAMMLPQYGFLIDKEGVVKSINPENLNAFNVLLDGYKSEISFNYQELELIKG